MVSVRLVVVGIENTAHMIVPNVVPRPPHLSPEQVFLVGLVLAATRWLQRRGEGPAQVGRCPAPPAVANMQSDGPLDVVAVRSSPAAGSPASRSMPDCHLWSRHAGHASLVETLLKERGALKSSVARAAAAAR